MKKQQNFKNETMYTLVNQIQEETPSWWMKHEFGGMKDQRGWLTRFPESEHEEFVTRQEMNAFLNAGGNPGALTCLIGMSQEDIQDTIAGTSIIPKLLELGIKGTNIYVFWSDCS